MSDHWAVVMATAVFAGALAVVDGHLPGVPLIAAVTVVLIGWLLVARGTTPGPPANSFLTARRIPGPSAPAPAEAGGHHVGATSPSGHDRTIAGSAVRWRHGARLRPAVLCLGAALLAGSLAQRSVDGLEAPVATGPVATEVVLVSDPAPDGRGGVRVDVRLDGRRLRATARVAAAAALDDRLAGERVTIVGQVHPPGFYERLLRHRHLSGRLAIETVVGWRAGEGVTRLANGLRRTLAHGAGALPERQASLLAGITLGDDRTQPADIADSFRAAGLTHLLAVSGQNVAFAMVIAAPVLRRLSFGPRLVGTLGVLALFALVTRAEPSVLRAVAMAAAAAVGSTLGRPAPAVRTLALGVAAMLLVDPLLASSLGFQLSVAGAAGIVAGARPLEAIVPGPRWLAAPLAVTLAAQLAVSPLLVAAFGAVPLASVPANLLAAPAAGPLMVWGLTGGLVAGVLGPGAGGVLHLPSRLMLWWLEAVATAAARWPLGDLRAGHVGVLGAAGLVLAVGRALTARGSASTGSGSPGLARVCRGAVLGAGMAIAAVLVMAMVARPSYRASHDGSALGPGATLWERGGAAAVVIDGRARADAVLEGLRDAGIRRVDVLVLRSGARAAVDLAAVLRRGRPLGAILVPGGLAAPPGSHGHISPPRGTVIDVGGLRLTVVSNSDGTLDVEVTPRPGHGRGWRQDGLGTGRPASGTPRPVRAAVTARRAIHSASTSCGMRRYAAQCGYALTRQRR